MPVVHYAPLGAAMQIEGFPKDSPHADKQPFKRSVEGALHLRPGSTFELTADELAWIREHHKDVATHIREVSLTGDEREEMKGKGGPPPDALGETEASRTPRPHDNETAVAVLPGRPPTEDERARESGDAGAADREGQKLQTAGDGGHAASVPGPKGGNQPNPNAHTTPKR